MIEKIKRHDEYSRLFDMIVSGKILPNERLVEADYAEQFSCSRANIRSALARLEQDGLVVNEPFKGARVRRITPEEAKEIYEVRAALEALVVVHATHRATEEDKSILHAIMAKMTEARDQGDTMRISGLGRKLREEFWRISHQDTATAILEKLNSQLIRTSFRTVLVHGRGNAITEELGMVVQHICDGDAENAKLAVQKYHDSALKNLQKALEANEQVY